MRTYAKDPLNAARISAAMSGVGFAADTGAHACNCIGPQNGQPVCPCQMRWVSIKDGRYVRVQDLGPAPAILSGEKP